MSKASQFARLLAEVERRVATTDAAPQLATSAIVDGSVDIVSVVDTGEVDSFGQSIYEEVLTAQVGLQEDGSNTVVVIEGPEPPAPSGLTVDVGAGTLTIGWPGNFVGGAVATLDHDYIAVHVAPKALVDGGTVVLPSDVTMAATIRPLLGGQVTLARDAGTEYYVALVAVTQAGKWSTLSEVITATPRRLVTLDFTPESITDTLIAPDAVTTPKIRAAAVQAGNIDANAVTAEKLEAVLALVTKILAGPAAGSHVELGPDGMSVWRMAASALYEYIRLGGAGSADAFALRDETGALQASISGNGSASFGDLSVSGFTLAGKTLEEIMKAMARGLTGWYTHQANSATTTGAEIVWCTTKATLDSDRTYLIEAGPHNVDVSAVGVVAAFRGRIAYDGSVATISSDIIPGISVRSRPGSTAISDAPYWRGILSTAGQVSPQRECSIGYCVRLTSGSGTVNGNASASDPLIITVTDLGPAINQTSSTLKRTSTWNLTDWSKGGDSIPTTPPYATAQWVGETPGDILDWVQLQFSDLATSGETSKTVAQALTGATMVKAELIMSLLNGEDGEQISCNIRANTLVAPSMTTPSGSSTRVSKTTSSKWRAWQDISALFTTASRGIWLGSIPGDAPASALVAAPNGADVIQLRLTYLR